MLSHNGLRLPRCVCIRIIGKCNLSCPFCFGPDHSLAPANTSKLLNLIDMFPSLGVEHIGITGGEPLMDPDLSKILERIKHHGIRVLLNTNGTFLERQFDRICPYLDWIALPLDADSDEIHQLMRPGKFLRYNHLQKLIYRIKSEHPNLKIRIGTVASAINYNYIAGIPALLSGEYKPNVWKLYHFTPASYGMINREILDIPEELYHSIVSIAKQKAEDFNIPIEVYYRNMRDGMYFFLEPNGDAIVTMNGGDITIGNFFSNLDSVLQTTTQLLNGAPLASSLSKLI